MKRLDALNALAKSGKTAKVNLAERGYGDLVDQYPDAAPGLWYNAGMAHTRIGQWDKASIVLEKSLMACGNYIPAFKLMLMVLRQAGRTRTVTCCCVVGIGPGNSSEASM